MQKLVFLTGWLWCFIFVFHFLSTPTSALILITEVHPNPASGPEWVELYNDTSVSASLSGWTLKDQLSTPSVIHTFSTEVIPPLAAMVIELASSKLNNTADGVLLLDPDGATQDSMQYETTEAGKSWIRRSLNSISFLLSHPSPGVFSPQPQPTPTTTPSPTPVTTKNPKPSVAITAISPCPPTGETEWIRLHNAGPDSLDLSGWKVKDAQNNSRALSGTFPAGQQSNFSWTAGMLNNTGDEVFLHDPAGLLIASASYENCQNGAIFSLQDGQWLPDQPPDNLSINTGSDPNSTAPSTQDGSNPDSADSQSSLQPTASAFPTPLTPSDFIISPDLPPQEPLPNKALFLRSAPPLDSPQAPASVILGGLLISAAGIIFIYEQNQDRAENHPAAS